MADSSYPTITHAFLTELGAIVRGGDEITARGQASRELCARLIRVQQPRHRILLAPYRYNNVFATIAETIWVLAGRNDLAFLSHYLPRAAEFSDDGRVWRGGYGPRLRNWHGIDQIRSVVQTLLADPASRRAVITLFDPASDNVSSKDIPCNNWLHALIRRGHLHLSVAIRSNDIMWGFSGINTFEWSVLQEFLAHWTNTGLGAVSYFIDSLHLYARHYGRAQQILAHRRSKTLYDFGFESPRFFTSIESFDETLAEWLAIEATMRQGKQTHANEWERISDGLLRTFLQLTAIYNRYLAGAHGDELAELIVALPESDLKLAAIDYLARMLKNRDFVALTAHEATFFDYLWNDRTPRQGRYSFEHNFRLLGDLHTKKTLVYGDSWRKHGEVLGVFANITRKYDRLEHATDDSRVTLSDESILDTIADLAVYCTKYLTLLAELHPDAFAEFAAGAGNSVPITAYQGNDGFDAVARLLTWQQSREHRADKSELVGTTRERIQKAYATLEHMLVGLGDRENIHKKILVTAEMASASVQLLIEVSEQDQTAFELFAEAVERL